MAADIIGIIPARFGSTRFPGKPLADINGLPMVCRVFERAAEALGSDNVYVATDDNRIMASVTAHGGNAVLASGENIVNGTARCANALRQIGRQPGIVVNIQGDEPMIDPDDIRNLVAAFTDQEVEIATLARRFNPDEELDTLLSTDNPKVVMDSRNNALYFSRAVIPFVRPDLLTSRETLPPFYLHVGTYAFRRDVLDAVVGLPPTAVEQAERLEQLRWLAAGYRIKIILTDNVAISIDTPSDLEKLYEKTRQL